MGWETAAKQTQPSIGTEGKTCYDCKAECACNRRSKVWGGQVWRECLDRFGLRGSLLNGKKWSEDVSV